jgi:beta-lysine 5,6-aminomutase alpha subunit
MRLPLNETTINACRQDAKTIAHAMKTMIDDYTTVSVERTITRFLGIDGVNDFDIPYANVLVDHVIKEANLDKGIAHFISYAMHDTNQSPQAIAEAVDQGTLTMASYQDKPASPYMDLLTPYIQATLDAINTQTNQRNQFLTTYPRQDQPEKYVIVATGNIHEDIKQAVSAAKKGADVIAVIRTTGQSLLDYVPYGATTEGFGGTYATQENFRLMRQALDEVSKEEHRYIKLVNYASGLCMPEIAALGAIERLDMMLNDSLYGIIFRDINMKRTMIDQYFSRVISAYADITINTGEDNYLTTADAFHHAHNVLASQFINEQFAKTAYMKESLMGLGHAYEIDPAIENSFLYEIASAQLSRDIFKNAPLKYMPPTKHMTGDIFKGTELNTLFNIATVTTNQNIHLLGMITEAIHTPFMSDRALALDNASLIYKAFKDFGNDIIYKDDGIIATRAIRVLDDAKTLLDTIKHDGLFTSLEKGVFADVKRSPTKGKGLDGVIKKHPDYHNPVMTMMITHLKEANHG